MNYPLDQLVPPHCTQQLILLTNGGWMSFTMPLVFFLIGALQPWHLMQRGVHFSNQQQEKDNVTTQVEPRQQLTTSNDSAANVETVTIMSDDDLALAVLLGCKKCNQKRNLTAYPITMVTDHAAKRIKISYEIPLTTEILQLFTHQGPVVTLDSIPLDVFMNQILLFVGDNQYRFVGAVNQYFQKSYIALFPKKSTHYNVSTLAHAKLCFDDITHDIWQQIILCKQAARDGNLPVLQHLHSFHCEWGSQTCASAALNGHLDVLRWLRAHDCPWNASICDNAALNGHWKVIQWAVGKGCPFYEQACQNAALNGHLKVLECAHAKKSLQGSCASRHICSNAASKGHLDILKWARQNEFWWNERTCYEAAENGHLDVLKWARSNGCPWDKYTCSSAAEGGHLDVLKWAHANGCPWDEYTCSSAAESGQLDVLKWAHANGCPWDNMTLRSASNNKHQHIVQWAEQHGCPDDSD
jgi:hypothetical protein